MLLRSPTLMNLAAMVMASASLFACGSDEANPGNEGTVGGGTSVGSSGASGNSGSVLGRGGSANGGASLAQGGTETATGGASVAQTQGGSSTAAAGRGNAGAGNLSCTGVADGDSCTQYGRNFICDRSATANPRICTCSGNPLTWDCVTGDGTGGRANGVGGRAGGGRANGGSSGRATGGAATGGRANGNGGSSGRGNGGSSGRGNGGSSGRGNGGASTRGGSNGVAGSAAGAASLPRCDNGIQDGDTCQANDDPCESRNGDTCVCGRVNGAAGGSNRREWSCG